MDRWVALGWVKGCLGGKETTHNIVEGVGVIFLAIRAFYRSVIDIIRVKTSYLFTIHSFYMYLLKNQAQDLLRKVIDDLLNNLKGNSDFMVTLIQDDDWSMIIKSHALIESLVTELLLAVTEEPKLRKLIERLPLSDEQMGKVKIAKDYELLSSRERAFIKKLSSLRNDLVHDFENINFKLEDYVKTLSDNGQKKSWQSAFTWYEEEEQKVDSWKAYTLSKPKIAVWMAIFQCVSLLIIQIKEVKTKSQFTNLSIGYKINDLSTNVPQKVLESVYNLLSDELENQEWNQFSLEQAMRDLENDNLPEYTKTDLIEKWQ